MDYDHTNRMIELLPLEIIMEIISYLRHWKDLLLLMNVKNKRISKIINTRKKELLEERKISNNFAQYDDDKQINKKNAIMKISKDLPFDQLPWKYQTTDKCMRAIRMNFGMYDYVRDKTDEIRLLAANCHTRWYNPLWDYRDVIDAEFIKKFGLVLKYISKQTPEMCILAVKQNGNALQYVSKQTPEICLLAVEQNGYALQYVRIKQTPEICLQAVKQNGHALQYVLNQTPEICIAAVDNDGFALHFVLEQTEELCLIAVKKRGLNLMFVKEQTEEMCLLAVKQDGHNLKLVRDQIPKICKAATRQRRSARKHVKILF